MLTVACVWVHGPVPYTVDYVVRLERMVWRYLERPFRFVCLTDRPGELPAHITAIPIDWPIGDLPPNGVGYWAKVSLFDRRLFNGRVLYIDLDSLIVSDLSPIVDYPAPFAITADALIQERAHLDRDRYGRLVVRRFNSSVMVWDAGQGSLIWDDWMPSVTARLSTDQDWIAELYPEAAAIPSAWFPRIGMTQPTPEFQPWPADAKVVLVKKPKPHEAVARWPWFDAMWGGW